MSNNSNNLEDKTTYMVNEFNEVEEKNTKFISLIDIKGKRRFKNSTPTLILNTLEKLKGGTLKEVENKLVSSKNKSLIANFNKANLVRIAKGNEPYSTLREYVRVRINKVKTYYFAKDIIKDIFNERPPIVNVNGKFYITYIKALTKG